MRNGVVTFSIKEPKPKDLSHQRVTFNTFLVVFQA